MEKEYAIEFRHVSKIYSLKSKNKEHAINKRFYALKDINFKIPKGEVVGILGTKWFWEVNNVNYFSWN